MVVYPDVTVTTPQYNYNPPSIVVVDDFLTNPDEVRKHALTLMYAANLQHFKGVRSLERADAPRLKEHFERLLNVTITDWESQPYNGVFQLTGDSDPLVYHSDLQRFAAAIYLTPQAPIDAGTSFWKSKEFGYRRPSPDHMVNNVMYREFNLLNQDNWQLVDRVGAVYNRLVLWDAQLIHSATSYQGLSGATPEESRLVQLFFFNARHR